TEYLTERAGIGDTIGFIQALESGERVAAIAELAVVIVLDDPCAHLGSPCQQFESTGERERDSQWTLVRWRNNCEAPLGGALNRKTGSGPGRCTGDWNSRRAGFCRPLGCGKIAGILEQNDTPGCQQRSGDQPQCPLVSRRNEYLCSGASNPACNG